MNESKEIVQAEGKEMQTVSPAQMILQAVQGNADLEKLQGLLDLQMKYEANEARKVYADSMVEVHKNIPMVAKTLKNPQTHSNYASLESIICKTKEVYTSQGFSISFYEGETTKPEHVRACADVVHRAGHKETFYYDMPLDGKGIKGNVNMTPIHAKSSSMAYARRYLMCMIWNIPTGDDDGNAAGSTVEVIDEKQLSVLRDYIDNDNTFNMERFLAYMKIESLETMPKAKYQQAIVAFQQRESQKKSKFKVVDVEEVGK